MLTPAPITCRHCHRPIPPNADGSPGWYRVLEGFGRRAYFCSPECFGEVERYVGEARAVIKEASGEDG